MPTLESLAVQLRDGPLKCLAALRDHAEALAQERPSGDGELLVHLQTLVTLAQCSMTQFHEFTTELRALVDHIALKSARDPAGQH